MDTQDHLVKTLELVQHILGTISWRLIAMEQIKGAIDSRVNT